MHEHSIIKRNEHAASIYCRSRRTFNSVSLSHNEIQAKRKKKTEKEWEITFEQKEEKTIQV